MLKIVWDVTHLITILESTCYSQINVHGLDKELIHLSSVNLIILLFYLNHNDKILNKYRLTMLKSSQTNLINNKSKSHDKKEKLV